MLPSPRALLLDFGGVIVDSPPDATDLMLARVVGRVKELIGGLLSEEEITSELKRADVLRDELRGASHEEVGHERLWGELVADLWPDEARVKVVAHADELSYLWASRPGWRIVEGMWELLDYTVGKGLPVAVVSNTRCGQAHREALDRLGLTGAFTVQIYSDEIGFCKPHPELIWAATRELDLPASACWMVGDQPLKDIACARRAGAGAVLMGDRAVAGHEPDATVAHGHELLALVRGND